MFTFLRLTLMRRPKIPLRYPHEIVRPLYLVLVNKAHDKYCGGIHQKRVKFLNKIGEIPSWSRIWYYVILHKMNEVLHNF